jgi:hypothetical protein
MDVRNNYYSNKKNDWINQKQIFASQKILFDFVIILKVTFFILEMDDMPKK